jgi:carbonic anhydrase
MALGVRDIIVCGHSDCGAMKAVANPTGLAAMPNVASWLKHSAAAESVVTSGYQDLTAHERVHAIALENVVAQIAHLRTHPSVAAGIARGDISLHGWLVDIHAGQVLGLDGRSGRFVPMREGNELPVAHPARQRLAADFALPEAAE